MIEIIDNAPEQIRKMVTPLIWQHNRYAQYDEGDYPLNPSGYHVSPSNIVRSCWNRGSIMNFIRL